MKKNNKYSLHIINKLAGNISPDNEKELAVWLEADVENQEEYNLIAKIVSEGQQMEFPSDPNVQYEWNAFKFPADPLPKQNIVSYLGTALNESIVSVLQPRRLAYVALFIFMIGVSAFWYFQSIHSIETITTANRQQKEITLSDGTTVYLNYGTELSYPQKFTGKTRQVTLKGEAFFDDAKTK